MNKDQLSATQLRTLPKVLHNNELMSFILSGTIPNDALERLASYGKTVKVKVTEADLIAHSRIMKARRVGLEPAQLSPSLRWLQIAIALPIQVSECSCGTVYEAPAGPLLIHREHARFGTHYELLADGVDYSHLPNEHYFLYQKITHCQACFTADSSCEEEKIITEEKEQDQQDNSQFGVGA